MKKKFLVLIVLQLLTVLLLAGCGVSDEKKEMMFNYLRDEGYIEVDGRAFSDYDNYWTESQSPVPAVFEYYEYDTTLEQYVIRYDYKNRGNDDWVYIAKVSRMYGDVEVFNVYSFKYTEKLHIFKKMELVGID